VKDALTKSSYAQVPRNVNSIVSALVSNWNQLPIGFPAAILTPVNIVDFVLTKVMS